MRLKEGKTNTHGKPVKGAMVFPDHMMERELFVRFTSDGAGETLSIEAGPIMLVVPFEPVAEIIKETRAERRTRT